MYILLGRIYILLGRIYILDETVRDGVLEIGFWDSPALISYLD